MREQLHIDTGGAIPPVIVPGGRKLSFGPGVIATPPPGFHMNLLTNSLTTKLKQRQGSLDRASRPPGCLRTKTASTTHHVTTEASEISGHRPLSGVSSVVSQSSAGGGPEKERLSPVRRLDSASSDKLPRLVNGDRSSSRISRRSSSAGQPGRSLPFSATARSHSQSTFHLGSDMSGSALSFRSKGPGNTIMVVKRDGLFQPMDKYGSGRPVLRDVNYHVGKGAACEYETYTLCCDDAVVGVGHGSPRGYHDMNKKRLTVSWSNVHAADDDPDDLELAECRLDGNQAPSSVKNNGNGNVNNNNSNTLQRPAPVDSFAFRRPVYSSGKSKVASIGLKWNMPTVAPDKEEEEKDVTHKPPVKAEVARKPMWSWLVMQDAKENENAHKSLGGGGGTSGIPPLPPRRVTQHPHDVSMQQPTFESASGSNTNSRHSRDVRSQRSKDIHPVSTAMNREGTSVSRTRWQVPSSNASTLDAERAAMGRLALVKRPGSRLLYEHQRGTSNSAAKQFREAMRSGMLKAERYRRKIERRANGGKYESERDMENEDEDEDEDDDDDDEEEGDDGDDENEYNDVMTNASTTRRLSSPAKSRSTQT